MRKLALIILDGWGLGEKNEHNAIYMAKTPFFDYLWNTFPKTKLEASGEFVGLPKDQIGGSEVGHLTIGGGNILLQELPRINKAIKISNQSQSLVRTLQFKKFISLAQAQHAHLIGLISPGGVHSHQEHLFKILKLMKQHGCKSPYIHFISDGRDRPPQECLKNAKTLINLIQELDYGNVSTLIGRYYAMDRDTNWDRTEKALDLYINGTSDVRYKMTPNSISNLICAFNKSYAQDITDEFIKPSLLDPKYRGIQPEEPIFFFNFRSDRMKQITTKISEKLPSQPIFTMTQYDDDYTHDVFFEKETLNNTLSEVISLKGMKQLKAAETEKAPHVSYFFNGGAKKEFDGEIRSIEQSHRTKHDEIPEMQAEKITKNIKTFVVRERPEFVVVNFANPDMVGHTGNFSAVVASVEKVDKELKKLCGFLAKHQYICCITADHGNADIMYDPVTQQPHTAHTLNPVPFIIFDPHDKSNQNLILNNQPANGLSKVARTILELMNIEAGNHFESGLL